MEKLKKNWKTIIYAIIIILLVCLMFICVSKKEGFHEDEIFSYTVSNSGNGDSLFPYGEKDSVNNILKTDSPIQTIKNLIYYRVFNEDLYEEKLNELDSNTVSVWKTSEDARKCAKNRFCRRGI